MIDRNSIKKGSILVASYFHKFCSNHNNKNSLSPLKSSQYFVEPFFLTQNKPTDNIEDSYDLLQTDLQELSSLLKTLQIKVLGKVIQKRQFPCKKSFIGKGKLVELVQLIKEHNAGVVVVDGDITPTQLRNLQSQCKCQVMDRAGVILDIFAMHASTHSAKIQVELAKQEYLLPRMVGAWTHFSRQKGGKLYIRGMGEKQIEIDRRLARKNIAKLKKKLEDISRTKNIQKKTRKDCFKVALVGYTNSGKTTLMQALSSSKIPGKDQLFATLSVRVKLMDPCKKPKILFADTIGFIRNFPHSLSESFRSTLQETLDADLCLHVVDLSHQDFRSQLKVTESVLKEIGCKDIEELIVFNKIDRCDDPLVKKIIAKEYPNSFIISAFDSEQVKNLSSYIVQYFGKYYPRAKIKLVLDNDKDNNNQIISLIYQNALINNIDYSHQNIVEFDIQAKVAMIKKIEKILREDNPSINIIKDNAKELNHFRCVDSVKVL